MKTEGGGGEIDDMDCTEGFVTSPKPFKVKLRSRGPWVEDLLSESADEKNIKSTHETVDLAAVLDGVAF